MRPYGLEPCRFKSISLLEWKEARRKKEEGRRKKEQEEYEGHTKEESCKTSGTTRTDGPMSIRDQRNKKTGEATSEEAEEAY